MNEIEKAIKDFEKFKQAGYTHGELPSSWHIELAISALRAQQEREKGCNYCHGWDKRCGVNYCPDCGKELQEVQE